MVAKDGGQVIGHLVVRRHHARVMSLTVGRLTVVADASRQASCASNMSFMGLRSIT